MVCIRVSVITDNSLPLDQKRNRKAVRGSVRITFVKTAFPIH